MSIFSRRVCARRLTETGSARCGELGIIEGTPVSLREGWRPVESLDRLDELRVFSGGYRQPTEIECEEIWLDPFDCPSVVRPLLVPQGALGNDKPSRLQQDMRVVVKSEGADSVFGTARVSLRAGALLGFRNIALEQIPPKKAKIFRILFDSVDAIEVAGAIWLLCPQKHQPLNVLMDGAWDRCRIGAHPVRHLTADEAAAFLVDQESLGADAFRQG